MLISDFVHKKTQHLDRGVDPQINQHTRTDEGRISHRANSEDLVREMGAVTTALIAIVAVALGWCTIEIACKPCLEKGREAIDRNLNPDYDSDEHTGTTADLHAPLNPTKTEDDAAASSTAAKTI